MGFGMCNTRSANQTTQQALDAVEAAADAPGAVLRLFDQEGGNSPGSNGGCNTSNGVVSKTPAKRWFSPKAATAGGFSAICLLSAVKLMQANPTVPVGAIESCVGGTRVEAWTPSNWPVDQKPGGPCAPGCLWHNYMVRACVSTNTRHTQTHSNIHPLDLDCSTICCLALKKKCWC